MIARKPLEDRVWDLCVVGTGPVGMTLALEFNRIGDEMHRP
jgi:2-polyprenyl-6-methoxyphenol hydroxylase-like FAD-dependent oxidoreductase